MMDSVEVARQITFDDPAPLRVRGILRLHPHCTNRVMNTAFGTEAVGTRVEVALPDRLHGHQHRPLDDAVQQDRYAQLAVGLRDMDSLDRRWAASAVQQRHAQPIQMALQNSSKSSLVHSVKSWCIGALRRQDSSGRLSKPIPVGDEPEQSIKPAGLIGRAHVASLCCISLIIKGLHLIRLDHVHSKQVKLVPFASDRLSQPRTTMGALPA